MTAEYRRPAEVFSPGEHLAEELEARGWSATDLAQRCGWTEAYTVSLLAGRAHVGMTEAGMLGAVLGTSAELWLNLDRRYRDWQRTAPAPGVPE